MATAYKVDYATPYYQNILRWLKQVGQGSGMVSQKELLELLESKPTKSFYRAMQQAVEDKVVVKVGIIGPKGGRAVAYEVQRELHQLRLPFEAAFPF